MIRLFGPDGGLEQTAEAPDGRRIASGYEQWGKRPARFSLRALALSLGIPPRTWLTLQTSPCPTRDRGGASQRTFRTLIGCRQAAFSPQDLAGRTARSG